MENSDRREKAAPGGGWSSRIDLFFRIAAILSLGSLIFLAGSVTAIEAIYPGPQIERAFKGGKALYNKLAGYGDIHATNLWAPAQRDGRGVIVHAAGKVQEGLTLYTSGSDAAAYLIDMDGKVVHEWRRPYSTVWKAGGGAPLRPQPDPYVYFRHAHAYPNGDLVAIYESAGDTPYGYGVVKLDRDSNVLWSYAGRAHHQLDVGPDGRIYVLTHKIVDDVVGPYDHLSRPRLEDFLVVLSPDGRELRKIRLIDTLARSKYRRMLFSISKAGLGDPLHANAVKYIRSEEAANFAFGREGQILLSFRETSAIAVLDLATQEIVWTARGPWLAQHDPDIMPNGNILLFDNQGAYDGPEGSSRVLEFDPRTMRIVWSYAGTPGNPLQSEIRSDQQRLANGNTLITESDGGRILEVTPEGEVAWEFINPVRGGDEGRRIPIVAWAQRLDPTGFSAGLLQPWRQPATTLTEKTQ